MTEYTSNTSGETNPKKGQGRWTAVRVFGVIDFLAVAFLVLGLLNDGRNYAENSSELVLAIVGFAVNLTGCVFLLLRRKLPGILLTAIGAVGGIAFANASGYFVRSYKFRSEQFIPFLLLDIIPAIILLILAVIAPKQKMRDS
ncbi:MAG: hypothetical protein LBT12_04550 [Oscillospiraceae bacterium]|nr:hypothetical protein [Oscillospiraceae bacterium]